MFTRREFMRQSAMAGIGVLAAGDLLAYDKKLDPAKRVALEKAWELHKKCLIIDGHNDVALTRIVTGKREIPLQWTERDNVYQSDIPRMRENGQQYVALLIVSAGTGSTANCFRNIGVVDQSIEQHPDAIMKVLTSADAVAAGAANKAGMIYAIEGSYGPLAGDLGNLKKLYDKGVRVTGITHKEGGAEPNYLQGTRSSGSPISESDRAARLKSDVGLTPFGVEALKAMNRIGVVVDLAHSNDRTFYDVIEKSTAPPIASHTVAYAVCPVNRGLTDDQIKALAAKGGVMGMTFVPGFIALKREEVTIDKFVDHICHAADVGGIDCVGIGSDYDGGDKTILTDEVSKLVLITQGLLNRAFTEEEIGKIWSGNFLRVLKKVVDKA